MQAPTVALDLRDTRSRIQAPETTGKRERSREESGDGALLCAACGEMITDRREGVAPNGSHEHTFVNPAGIIYQIACFRAAPGCRESGDPTGDWSWFPGYLWRYAFCRSCAEHLGWLYRSGFGEGFWGLIVPRLVEARRS